MAQEAVVLIDVQKGLFEIPGSPRPAETRAAGDAVVSRIADLLGRARARGVFVQHDGGAGHLLETGAAAWQIRDELAPQSGEPVIHKTGCDSFFQTTLDAELKTRGIGRLVIAGCMTQYCIDTSVRRAVSLGYDVTLVADGHMTIDTGGLTFEQIIAHHNNIFSAISAGGHKVSTELAGKVLA